MSSLDDPVAPDRLCYPGKLVELKELPPPGIDDDRWAGRSMSTRVDFVDGMSIEVVDRVPRMSCEIAVVCFGERFLARGEVVPSVSGSRVHLDREFRPVNVRSAPRIPVDLGGTYLLRPPHLGVPLRIVDIATTGLAIVPIRGQQPRIGDRRMIAFDINGREVKSVIEFVSLDPNLWRARFLKLALSDEDAIARLVIDRQVQRRHRLSTLEVSTPSSLDVETRFEYPLVDSIEWTDATCTLAAGTTSVTLGVPWVDERYRTQAASLVGLLRIGDPRDCAHVLRRLFVDDRARDSLLAPYLLLSARVKGISVQELIASYMTMALQTSCALDASLLPAVVGGPSVYSSGVIIQPPSDDDRGIGVWVDPIVLALVARSTGAQLVKPRWPALADSAEGRELVCAFASFASGEPNTR